MSAMFFLAVGTGSEGHPTWKTPTEECSVSLETFTVLECHLSASPCYSTPPCLDAGLWWCSIDISCIQVIFHRTQGMSLLIHLNGYFTAYESAAP